MSPVLNPICRGLVGHISYLAACKTSTVYSEYLLYEPLLRIAIAQGYRPQCEVPVGKTPGKGDHKRIDFRLESPQEIVTIEVKWIKSRRPNISKDVDKLREHSLKEPAYGYVLLFGPSGYFWKLNPRYTGKCVSRGRLVEWNAGKTRYSAQWLRFT